MNELPTTLVLTPADHAALTGAVRQLENPNFAARLADYAGAPIHRIMSMLPRTVNRRISGMVRDAVMKAIADIATKTAK